MRAWGHWLWQLSLSVVLSFSLAIQPVVAGAPTDAPWAWGMYVASVRLAKAKSVEELIRISALGSEWETSLLKYAGREKVLEARLPKFDVSGALVTVSVDGQEMKFDFSEIRSGVLKLGPKLRSQVTLDLRASGEANTLKIRQAIEQIYGPKSAWLEALLWSRAEASALSAAVIVAIVLAVLAGGVALSAPSVLKARDKTKNAEEGVDEIQSVGPGCRLSLASASARNLENIVKCVNGAKVQEFTCAGNQLKRFGFRDPAGLNVMWTINNISGSAWSATLSDRIKECTYQLKAQQSPLSFDNVTRAFGGKLEIQSANLDRGRPQPGEDLCGLDASQARIHNGDVQRAPMTGAPLLLLNQCCADTNCKREVEQFVQSTQGSAPGTGPSGSRAQ